MAISINGTSGSSGVYGSAATPALQGSDSNTGISFGTDEVNISTGGTTRATVDSSGNFGIGTTSAAVRLSVQVDGFDGIDIKATTTNQDPILSLTSPSTNYWNMQVDASEGESLQWRYNNTERMRFTQEGVIKALGIYNTTTGAAGNVHVSSDGTLYRSTSSARYKTDIETIEDAYSDALLQCRPVWYRSTCAGDNPEHGWWGFIAEEVAEIDSRLVFWKTRETTTDIDGSTTTEELAEPIAEGVQYDRFVPHLLNLIKRQKEQLDTQTAAIASLEARLTALEGGAN